MVINNANAQLGDIPQIRSFGTGLIVVGRLVEHLVALGASSKSGNEQRTVEGDFAIPLFLYKESSLNVNGRITSREFINMRAVTLR